MNRQITSLILLTIIITTHIPLYGMEKYVNFFNDQEEAVQEPILPNTREQQPDFIKPQNIAQLEKDLGEINIKINTLMPDNNIHSNKKTSFIALRNKGVVLKNKYLTACTMYMKLINSLNKEYESFQQDYTTLQHAELIQLYSQLEQENNQFDNI